MAANSTHSLDVLKWIYKVIDSSETVLQAINAKKLVFLYRDKYPHKKEYDGNYMDNEDLYNAACNKISKLMESKSYTKSKQKQQ